MKRVFVKTFALTIAIFIIGFYFGIFLDSLRLEDVKSRMTQIDNLWNDARLMQSFIQKFSDGNSSSYCGFLLSENLKAGDRIYEEGSKVEEYEKINRFTPSIVLEKERYALLDLQFWMNSIDLKKACNADYSTVIYLYSQFNKTAEQGYQDRVLWELKQKCGSQIIYITFPSDMNISTIEVIKSIYNVTKTPAVLINESVVLYSPVTMRGLEEYIKC
ncbi:MAG: hypothetical protein V1678_05375 [Candidatus Aenigmatarchaeota archaeon]